jgi:disulfide bond formation protein DsbB
MRIKKTNWDHANRSTRLTYFIGFVAISVLLLISLYLQIFQGIMPCPLCTLQRFVFILLGVLFLIGLFISQYRGRLIINCLAFLVSLTGIFFSGRQIWLQRFPTGDNSQCGTSLQYMLQVLPLHKVIQKIFQGSAECAQRGWEFLSLNMAEWAFLWFSLFLGLTIYLFLRQTR